MPAVPKSRRPTEMPMDRASSSSTLIRRRPRHRSPLRRKGIMCQTTRAARKGAGRNRAAAPLHQHLAHQLFLEFPVQRRVLRPGRVTASSAPAQVKPLRAARTVSRSPA